MKQKRNRGGAIILILLLSVVFASCEKDKKGTAAKSAKENVAAGSPVLKIGFSIPTEREERWGTCVRLLKEKVSKLPNAELIVQSADNDSQKQYSQIENMITQGINVLLVAPEDAGAVGPVLDRCHENGIYIVGYTRTGTDCWMDAYMTFDFETIGKYQAEEAVKAYPKGNYVLCSCDDKMSSIAVPMHSGIMGVLQPYIDGGIFMLYWIMLFRMLIRVLPWQMWKTR